MIEAKIIEDSISEAGKRLTTMQLKYHRYIHAEAKTHRVISNSGVEYEQIILTQDAGFMGDKALSRNASSSRAIPVAKMIEQVRNDPAMPVHWGANQPGMQARAELTGSSLLDVQRLWRGAALWAANSAQFMQAAGLHKQVANRILEPFQWIHVIVTATEWDNYFALRDHEDAQPEIRVLAQAMKAATAASEPTLLMSDEWHLPYVTAYERETYDQVTLRRISAARCARVSFLTHDGMYPKVDADLALYDRLVGSVPLHASPVEHQGTPDEYFKDGKFGGTDGWEQPELHGNLVGWVQHRKLIES